MLLDRLQANGFEVVDCGAEPDGLGDRRGARLELVRQLVPRSSPSNSTLRIMCPPRLNGSIASSSSARPQSAPTPLGPHILWAENARKSQPSAWTSSLPVRRSLSCVDDDDRSPLVRPGAQLSTGLMVPSALETRSVATTFTLPVALDIVEGIEVQLAVSSSGITLKSAPVRFATYCHGTKLEWCSSSVTTTTSPGPRLERPHAYATRFSASVALRVKIDLALRGALMKRAIFRRAPSKAVGRALRGAYTPRWTFPYESRRTDHGLEHLPRLLRRTAESRKASGFPLMSCSKTGSPREDGARRASAGSLRPQCHRTPEAPAAFIRGRRGRSSKHARQLDALAAR